MSPARFQRKRVKGSRVPEGSVYVGRISRDHPGPWGNPFDWRDYGRPQAVSLHRQWLFGQPDLLAQVIRELAGKDLTCYCPLDEPCHGDTLLRVANGGDR